MEEFIEQMLELGATEDRAGTHTERMLVIEEARKLYREHIKNL